MDLCLNCMESDLFEGLCPKCGWYTGMEPSEKWHLHPGKKLKNQYIIGTVLGFGGFGVTYVAYDTTFNKKVAIKEYLPPDAATRVPGTSEVLMYSGEKSDTYKKGLEGFLTEARNLAKFNNNPNVVSVQDYFEENNTAYIVMEFLDGMSLKEYIDSSDVVVPVDTAITILGPIIEALNALHEEGIIHRDVSPDNIYITKDKRVKLLDFGAARHEAQDKSASLSVVLKPGYAPEEQYRSKGEQGPYTDVYAVAATLYKVITGMTPMESIERAVNDELKPPSHLGIKINKKVEKALMKALAVKAQDRFNNCHEFHMALLGEVEVDLDDKEAYASYYNYKSLKRRRLFTRIFAVVMVLGIAGFGFYAYTLLQNRPILTQDSDITASITIGVDSNINQEAIDEMITLYNQYYPNITVTVSESMTGDLVINSNNEMPQDAVLDQKLLDNMTEEIINADVKNYYEMSSVLPLGFDVPVIYYDESVLNTENIDITGIQSWTIDHYAEATSQVGTENILATDKLLNRMNEDGYESNFKNFIQEAGNIEISSSGYSIEEMVTADAAFYYGNASDYEAFKNNKGGFFGVMLPPGIDNGTSYTADYALYAYTTNPEDRNVKRAVSSFMYLMLTEEGQNILHIQNENYIPVNDNSRILYVESHNGLSFIEDIESMVYN